LPSSNSAITDAAPVAQTSGGLGMKEMHEKKRAEQEARKAEAKLKRDHEKRVSDLEMQIAALESQQQKLTVELESPESYESGGRAVQLNRELQGVAKDLARVTAEWEQLAGQKVAE
jgi:ATP-binding cassette subfamily F protein 3